MILRRLESADLDRKDFKALVRRGIYSGKSGIPINEAKFDAFIAQLLTGDNFAAVAEVDGELVAYIAGFPVEHPWLERAQLQMAGWYSEHPWAGIRLFRMMLAWARSRLFIKSFMITVNPESADRVRDILTQRGLKLHSAPSFLVEV